VWLSRCNSENTRSCLRSFRKAHGIFIRDVIDVGIEILPMKELQEEMSSGVGYYEGELYNLIREGRGVPPSLWFWLGSRRSVHLRAIGYQR